ncbi:MAG: hypothetical protein KBA55_11855 [Ruminococcus sp.]|nr:hypothetical protein [Ruminococcus sp.]
MTFTGTGDRNVHFFRKGFQSIAQCFKGRFSFRSGNSYDLIDRAAVSGNIMDEVFHRGIVGILTLYVNNIRGIIHQGAVGS